MDRLVTLLKGSTPAAVAPMPMTGHEHENDTGGATQPSGLATWPHRTQDQC